jgi:hypothetical protein
MASQLQQVNSFHHVLEAGVCLQKVDVMSLWHIFSFFSGS